MDWTYPSLHPDMPRGWQDMMKPAEPVIPAASIGIHQPAVSTNSRNVVNSYVKINCLIDSNPTPPVPGGIDQRLWNFFVKNWCPGRTTMHEFNPWLLIATQPDYDGPFLARAATSIAAAYVADNLPEKRATSIRRLGNELYDAAVANLNWIFEVATLTPEQKIMRTSLLILVMYRHAIVPEHQSSFTWGQILSVAEQSMNELDSKRRYSDVIRPTPSPLRVAQGLLVGRALILTEVMSKLRPDFRDADHRNEEACRFSWLLEAGSTVTVMTIFGGAGCSRRLLNYIGQITFLAVSLQKQYVEAMESWGIALKLELESPSFEQNCRPGPQSYYAVLPMGKYTITSRESLVLITGEIWRVTALIYLKCRVFRLPPDHWTILEHLDKLCRYCRNLPTSGLWFSADIPVFPIFLLGAISKESHHRLVSKQWFDSVSEAKVRCSARIVGQRLPLAWAWMDKMDFSGYLPTYVMQRYAWWEDFVKELGEEEHWTQAFIGW